MILVAAQLKDDKLINIKFKVVQICSWLWWCRRCLFLSVILFFLDALTVVFVMSSTPFIVLVLGTPFNCNNNNNYHHYCVSLFTYLSAWNILYFIYVISLRYFNGCATFHLLRSCIPVVSYAIAMAAGEQQSAAEWHTMIFILCARKVFGSREYVTLAVSLHARVYWAFLIELQQLRCARTEQDNRNEERKVSEKKGRRVKKNWDPECCGSSIIINTFKRMSFCAQFIIIPKWAQHIYTDSRRAFIFTFCHFRYSARQTEGTESCYDICRCVARVFIYHCSTLCKTSPCIVSLVRFAFPSTATALFVSIYAKPPPCHSPRNTPKRLHSQTIVPPLPTDSVTNHGFRTVKRGAVACTKYCKCLFVWNKSKNSAVRTDKRLGRKKNLHATALALLSTCRELTPFDPSHRPSIRLLVPNNKIPNGIHLHLHKFRWTLEHKTRNGRTKK